MSDGTGVGTQRLLQVLEAYGADPDRWPAADRENLRRLLSSGDPAIGVAVEAARELDSILAASPGPALDAAMSSDRFLARMRQQEQASHPLELDRLRKSKQAPGASRRLPWPAFGALAASLAAGLYVGAGGLAHEFILALLEDEVSEEELWSPATAGDAEALVEDDE